MCAIPSTRTENKLMTISPDKKIRRLTEVECERLQGFPDGWTDNVSSTQRYKSLGNAVTVAIVKLIAERLKETI